MWQDLHYALRQIRKAPVFATVAVLTLALGIGANTAIFTLLDQALLRSLPVSHPEQLVRLRFVGSDTGQINYYGGDEHDYFSYPMYRDLRDKNQVFSGMLANDEAQVGVQWQKQPDLASGELVTANYFDVLGVRPAVGRLLVPADDAAQNGNPVVVLSFNYWKTRFAADPTVIGQVLMVNGRPFTIVGVTQPGFRSVISGYTPQLFFPLTTKPLVIPGADDLNDRRSKWLTVVGRLKSGEDRATAEGGINPLWHSIRAEELPQIEDSTAAFRRGFLDESKLQLLDNARGFSPLRDQISVPLMIVMGMVGLVLLMACVNVSSLLLVRAAGRTREMAVRYSLGAGRWRIVRQLLTEGLILGMLGGSLGLLLAPLVSSVLARRIAGDASVELPFSTQPDHRILLFNFGLAVVVSLLFSLAPVVRLLRPDLVNALRQQQTTAAGGTLRFRRLSVGVQIGLSLLLLIGAGLFVQTLRRLHAVKVGFETDHLLTFGVDPALSGYQSQQILSLHQRILHDLAAQPGVRAVAATNDPELRDEQNITNVSLPSSSGGEQKPVVVEAPRTTPGYFATVGIPLLAGRDFSTQDVIGKPEVVIVNSRFARHYFGDPQNAIGKFLGHGNRNGKPQKVEIIGVVADSKHANMRADAAETVYRAFYQQERPSFLEFYVRTWQSPEAAETDIRAAMRQLDSKLVLDGLRTMDEQVAESMSNERLIALLAVSFGLLATLMAAIGLYGVLAYVTAQRTHEIGIRMALGARRQAVVRLVLSDVLWLAGISIAVTLPIAVMLSHTLRSQLYNVSPADPMVIGGGVLLVSLVVGLAALLPARRAASVEPMQALRTE